MRKKRCLFIINPISGLGKQKEIPALISRHVDKKKYAYELTTTRHAGHAYEIASERHQEFDIMVAVGGDGTVNEVASGLIAKDASLAVIPLGSGNGFARHFDISTQPARAIQQLNSCQSAAMDVGMLNNKPFFNVAGVGFDGQISKIFAEQLKRGYMTYARCVIEELKSYEPKKFSYEINGKEVAGEFFLIAFANTTQYGNNAVIAPEAHPSDGLLDVVIVKPFPPFYLPAITMMTLFRSLHHSPYVEVIKTPSVVLQNFNRAPIHIDGEYLSQDIQVEVTTQRQSLKVMVPIK